MSKANRPNRIHGRQKNQQIDKLKKEREEKRQAYIKKMKEEGTYDGISIFDIVSKYKTVSYGILTIIAVFAFVVGPAYYAAIQGGPNNAVADGDVVLAAWDDGKITRAQAISIQDTGQRLQQYISTLVNNALPRVVGPRPEFDSNDPNFQAFQARQQAYQQKQAREYSNLDPWSLAFQPSDPTTVKFLSGIADEYGMGASVEEIEKVLQELYKNNTDEEVQTADKQAFGEFKEVNEIAELLLDYVSARKMQRYANSGIPIAPAISDRYVAHEMLTQQHKFEVLVVPVDTNLVTEKPGADEQAALIEQFREAYADDTGAEGQFGLIPINGTQAGNQFFYPYGVRTPRKYGYQFVAFNEDAYARYARVKFEEGITDENLKTYYETNIEQYQAPDDKFDEIENEAEGKETDSEDAASDDPEATEDDASEESSADKTEKEDSEDAAKEAGEDAAEQSTEEGEDCLIFFQEAPSEETKEEAPAESENAASDDAEEAPSEEPAAETEPEETGEEAPESETPPAAPAEDLSELDTPIPLEQNVFPEPPKTYLPYEEVQDRVREDYIRTSITAFQQELEDAHKLQLTEAMEAFSSASGESDNSHAVQLAQALSADASGDKETSTNIRENAKAVLDNAITEIQKDAEGIMTEVLEGSEDKPQQITLVTYGETAAPISAAHGQAISGRNPDANDFGLPWDESTPSWVKLIRIAYTAHGGPGSNTQQDIFIENDFLTHHESSSFHNHKYVFWQVDQTNETSFEDLREPTEEVLENATRAWKKGEAVQRTRNLANELKAQYNDDNGAQSFSEVLDDFASHQANVFESFPTTTFSMVPQPTQFGRPEVGLQLGRLSKTATEMVEAPKPTEEATDEQAKDGEESDEAESADKESTDEAAAENETESASPELIEKIVEGDTISDISDYEKLYIFEELEVNQVYVASSTTGRFFYVIRKIDYQAPAEDGVDAKLANTQKFQDLAAYLVGGPASMSPTNITASMTANATENMYSPSQGSGTRSQLEGAFIAILQKKHDFHRPSTDDQ